MFGTLALPSNSPPAVLPATKPKSSPRRFTIGELGNTSTGVDGVEGIGAITCESRVVGLPRSTSRKQVGLRQEGTGCSGSLRS